MSVSSSRRTIRAWPALGGADEPVPLKRSLSFTFAPLASVSSSSRGSSPTSLVAIRYALCWVSSLMLTSAPCAMSSRALSTSFAKAAAISPRSRSAWFERLSPPSDPQPASASPLERDEQQTDHGAQ